MNRSAILAVGFAGALALAASPATAQHRRDGGENRGGGNGGARAEQRAPQQPQQQQPQQQQPRVERGPEQRAEPRPEPRVEQRAGPRQESRQDNRRDGRQEYRGGNRPEYRGDYRAVPRTYAAPRYVGPRNGYSAPRYYSGRYYGPRYVGPRFSVAPRRFYRPYYVFRPRFSIGFGIWAGYPITYYDPFYYPYDDYPYASATPGAYPVAPPSGAVAVQPNQSSMGGVSFDVQPSTAEIWVDGNYFGTVDQFTPSSQPLGLTSGRHHLELREPGYQVSSFDVDVMAGQVIPFQGQLEP